MKRKVIVALLSCMLLATALTGCGKKKNSVGDNLIKEDPTKIQNIDEFADLGNTNTPSSVEEMPQGEIVDTISVNAVSSDSISSNEMGESVSMDSISDNQIQEDVADEQEEDLGLISAENAYIPAMNNTLGIANTSGRNLSAVYVTLSAGNLKGSEILGSKRLKDGGTYTYTIDDMDSLRNAGILNLSITAIDKNEKDINFGEIDIVDPNNMTIVLAHGEQGYYMYQY